MGSAAYPVWYAFEPSRLFRVTPNSYDSMLYLNIRCCAYHNGFVYSRGLILHRHVIILREDYCMTGPSSEGSTLSCVVVEGPPFSTSRG